MKRWGWLLCVFCFSCDTRDLCDVDRLQGALNRASRGASVRMGRCRIDGQLTVPDEVTLLGTANDADEENGIFSDTGAAVTLAPGASLENVYVASSGDTAVLVRGEGMRQITDVRVDVRRGAGLAVQGARVVASRVSFNGPIADPNDSRYVRVAGFRVETACPDDLVCDCTPGEVMGDQVCNENGQWATWTAVYGIYAQNADLQLDDVDVSAVAEVGTAFIDSDVMWNGGSISGVLGVGSLVRGGNANLDGVRIDSTAEGLRGTASYAVIATGDADLVTANVVLADNDRYGLLTAGATGDHVDLVAENNGDVGVWVGDSASFHLSGTGSRLAANGFAGIVVTESDNVMLEDATVEGTTTVRRTLGDLFGAQEIGDGVHLSGSTGLTLRSMQILSNARGGLLVDLTPGMPTFEDVNVDVSSEGFGAVAGDRMGGDITTTTPGGWDVGVTRSAAATAADAAFSGVIDAIGVSAPPSFGDRVGIVFPMF